ncbi:MAG TPA: CYTH domain-containing protein [Nitrosomonas europaea]|uniref:CYTH domain-containing protein n=1 Tax=Nitrosomonas europaea TaxID=915 RepID=UPI002492D480|nr:CYTH domain-containing protein [Nitrosomonas europaea]HRN81011.1 CYTH domain-containing protein [Nitrosomonas europaea]HRO55768.1 CYTH domain-containing protein [Nitrosomonas europaea]HRQ07819.1 CYTH domain-containing protein [Nitrosomonas europaea]HUM73496.1 CYTH domain-containing protein [Nitrosomonas europaea]
MTEIERKFLVATFPDGELHAVPLRQGYLTTPTDSIELRLRQQGTEYFMTLKSEGGLSRQEYEIQIDVTQFEMLWPATEGRRVEKTRYSGKLPDGQLFELDVFAGHLSPLMLVEVEFLSEDAAQAFIPPPWFREEVTEDKRYKNKALALSIP